MSNVLSQSLNGSLTSPQSNHSNSELENCNHLLNGQSTTGSDENVNLKQIKKDLVENDYQTDLEQQHASQDQPMEEDEEPYGEEEENFDEEDQLSEQLNVEQLKKSLAGELERQLNANNSNVTNQLNNLNNLNNLLGNSGGNSLLNNLTQWNPAALAALSNSGNLSSLNNFNGLAGLTQALNAASAFNGTLNQQQQLSNNQNSSQNSSTGSQHNLTPTLNASQLSNNTNLNYQNGSNGTNALLTHVEAAKGYTFEEQFKQVSFLFVFRRFRQFFVLILFFKIAFKVGSIVLCSKRIQLLFFLLLLLF